jgi:flagellin
VATVEFNNAGAGGATDLIEVNGVSLTVDLSGGSAALKATALKTAIEAETSLSGLAVVDNSGSLTITDADGDDITFKVGATFNANSDFDIETTVNGSTTTDNNILNAAGNALTVTGDIDFTTGSDVVVKLGSDDTAGKVVSSAAATGTNTASTNRVDDINISTVTGANTALGIIDSALTSIDSQRATLGAVQNRFDSVVSNLANVAENSSAARSRIMDADFAQETAQLAKTQILQQAGISVLAQANAQPQNVLALLQ